MNRFIRKGSTVQHFIGEELRATVADEHFAEYCESAGIDINAITVEE